MAPQVYDMSNPEDKILLDLVLNSGDAEKNIMSMRREIRELQGDMMKLDPNSDGFKEAAKQAAALKDEIADATESMQAFEGAGSLEGARSSFGRLGEQLKNLDFDGAANSVRGLSNSLSNIKFSSIIGGLKSLGGAMSKLAISILTNPIFLIAAAVAGITAALYFLIKATNEQSASQKILNDALAEVEDLTKENTNNLELMGMKLNTLDKDTKAFNKTLKEYNDLAEKEGLIILDVNSSMEDINRTISYNEKLYRTLNAQKVQEIVITNSLTKIKENELEIEEARQKTSDIEFNKYDEKIGKLSRENAELQKNIGIYVNINSQIDKFLEKGITNELEKQLVAWETMGGVMAQVADQVRKMNDEREQTAEGLTKEEEEQRKVAVDQWKRMYDAAQKYYDTLWINSLEEADRAKVLYERDLAEYEKNLRLKLWTKEQYDNALIIREKEYLDFIANLNKETVKKIEDDRLKEKAEAQKRWKELMQGELGDAGLLQQQYQQDIEMFSDMYRSRLITLEQFNDSVRTLNTNLWADLWQIQKDALYAEQQIKYNNQVEAVDSVMSLEQVSYKTRLGMLQEYFDNGLISEEQYNNASKQLQLQRMDNYKQVTDIMANIANELFQWMENRAEGNAKAEKKVARRKFNVDKGVSAVRSIINTAEGVTKALTLTPPFSFITAALTAASGAVSLATILSKKFPEEGASGADSSIPSSMSSASSVPTPTDTTLFGTGGGTPTVFSPFGQGTNNKVYVLESDITQTQNDVAKVYVQSTL